MIIKMFKSWKAKSMRTAMMLIITMKITNLSIGLGTGKVYS